MFDSKRFWENRYKNNGNSGCGSYGHLAEFKAIVINNFVYKNNINSIIDYGVGDGNQLKLINTENIKYIGIDISPTVIENCKKIFIDDETKTFLLDNDINSQFADLVLSCDVIYHLIEDNVYEKYMKNLFNMSKKYVIIYSKNEDINHTQHVKFRKFTNYIQKNFKEWKCIRYIPNKYPQKKIGQYNDETSPSDFYIFENFKEQMIICDNWINYIENKLLPIINVKLEGNIYSKNNTNLKYNNLESKRYNIINLIKKHNPKNVLEIGFNSGFSSLLMKMTDENINLTCIDINEHEYVIPCFNTITSDYKDNMMIILKPSQTALQELILQNIKYDLIHIDGDHSLSGARKDLELCLKLSHSNTVIIFDDTNLKHLNDLCENFINNGYLTNYEIPNFLNCIEYKHRFFNANILNIPIYISLTSIFNNQDILLITLQSIINQSILPDKIYLYLSEEPYLLDKGFYDKKITNENLIKFIENNSKLININWVENEGSYRKLLPLLKEKWNDDCIIITIDDDTIYDKNLIKNLVNDYNKNKCVINYRGFTPKMNKLQEFDYTIRKNNFIKNDIYNFPTGKGGILYKPIFFHKTGDLIFNKELYMNYCSKQDDVWFYLVRIKNNINCYIDIKKWQIKDLTNGGLYLSFNNKNNNNTKVFHNILNQL